MKGCIFCNKANLKGEIFYTTQNFNCVYNIRPVFPGHSLIISKRHMTSVLQMNEDEIEELPSVVKVAMLALKKAYKPTGFNIVVQEGKDAGASINHLHLHVLPRRKDDVPKNVEWADYFRRHEHTRSKLTKNEMAQNVSKIIRAIKRL